MNISTFRNNLSIIVTCIVGFVVIIFASKSIYYSGNTMSENPSLSIPSYVNIIEWGVLICSFLLLVVTLILWITKHNQAVKIVLVILIALFILLIGAETSFSKYLRENNAVSTIGNVNNANLSEISLYTLDEYFSILDDDIPVYIGRTDCSECSNFEEKISPFLDSNTFAVNTYFTNSDRDGLRSKEMYALLEKYGISSVPTFIVIRDGTVLKMWDDPANSVTEIEEYLSEWLQNHP